jgi:hypothetical protein
MEKSDNSLRHFPPDLWWVLGMPFTALVAVFAASWLPPLHGAGWLWAAGISFGIALVGATLLLIAKLPLYRQGRYFSLGIRALPESSRGYYRWGCGCSIVGCVLLLLLWLVSFLWG